MYENTEDLDRLKTSSLVLTVIFSQGEHNIFNVMSAIFQLLMHPHCKRRLAIFPSPAGMSLTKLSLAGNY
jgi:hypothetical protein